MVRSNADVLSEFVRTEIAAGNFIRYDRTVTHRPTLLQFSVDPVDEDGYAPVPILEDGWCARRMGQPGAWATYAGDALSGPRSIGFIIGEVCKRLGLVGHESISGASEFVDNPLDIQIG